MQNNTIIVVQEFITAHRFSFNANDVVRCVGKKIARIVRIVIPKQMRLSMKRIFILNMVGKRLNMDVILDIENISVLKQKTTKTASRESFL